jgi:hypothetical protein
VYIKAAQFAAARRLLPREYSTQLSQLQDRAPHVSFEEIDGVLVQEFGRGSAELFKDFDREPLAAASLAQVHLATLPEDGERVAVKIQRPGLRRTIDADLALLSGLARVAEAAFPALEVNGGNFDNEGIAESSQRGASHARFRPSRLQWWSASARPQAVRELALPQLTHKPYRTTGGAVSRCGGWLSCSPWDCGRSWISRRRRGTRRLRHGRWQGPEVCECPACTGRTRARGC